MVSVALPEIGRDLGADLGSLQWTLNGYLLTLASLILLGGALGDRYGRRLIFNVGIAWFGAASVLCALAPTVEALIAARVLQGIGGALLTPGSLAIIEATFHPSDRARAIGAWAGLGGAAAAIGPLVGGYLIDAVSWRAIFWLNVPLAVFVIVMANRHVPETKDPTAGGRLDYRGSLLVTLGLAGLTFALIQAPEQGVASAGVVLSLVIGVAAAIAFVFTELHTPNPMISLDIFKSRQFTSANLVTFVVYAALGGVFFLLVVFLQVVLGYSPLAAGAASAPVTLLLLLLSPWAGSLSQRIGPKIPLTVGPIVIGAGFLLLSTIDAGDSYFRDVLPGIVVFGLGLALVVAPVTATVLAAADPRHAGVASAVNNAVARIAGLIAVAVFPLIAGLSGADLLDPEALAGGFQTAMIAAAVMVIAGGVLAWLTISNDVLDTAPVGDDASSPARAATDRSCGIAGTPLRPAREARCVPASDQPAARDGPTPAAA